MATDPKGGRSNSAQLAIFVDFVTQITLTGCVAGGVVCDTHHIKVLI